jgi:hypothetical protein
VQAGVAIFNVLVNLWIIPAYSWRGAAWSSIASDALLLTGVGTAVWLISHADEKCCATENIKNETEGCTTGLAVETSLARETVSVE